MSGRVGYAKHKSFNEIMPVAAVLGLIPSSDKPSIKGLRSIISNTSPIAALAVVKELNGVVNYMNI